MKDQHDLKAAMAWSITAGSAGIMWFILCTPQQILTVLVKNYLGASNKTLGLLIGGINLAAFAHLSSMVFYNKLNHRKTFWIITTLLQRLLAFPIGFAAFHVAQGGSKTLAVGIILVTSILGAVLGNLSGSGWWAWMADLFPENIRSSFFGKRSAVNQAFNIVFFFGATLVLDLFDSRAFYVFGVLYTIGGLGGVLDVLFHLPIPEPHSQEEKSPKLDLFQPMRDKTFRRFCLTIGLFLLSMNIAGPFLAPFTTAQDGLGAPNIWLGILFVISQFIWILIVPFWGTVMDRLGKKPVVIMGGLFVLSWVLYIFMTPENYVILLPLAAALGGLLAPAFWEGISQMMLSLSPPSRRTAYAAWYWTAFGVMAAAGPFLGGILFDFLTANPLSLGGWTLQPMAVVILLSIFMVLVSLSHMASLPTKEAQSLSLVLSTVVNPGIFRAYTSMGLLSKSSPPLRVESVLRKMTGDTGKLAEQEVLDRLEDPDSDVREEAARALGRIGGGLSEEALIGHVKDTDSPLRSDAAEALGRLSSKKAVPALIECLWSGDFELQEAAAKALGRIEEDDSIPHLIDMMRKHPSIKVQASGALAISQKGRREAANEIYGLMHSMGNPILRRQLALSLANLFGPKGGFYSLLSGSLPNQAQQAGKLYGQLLRKWGLKGLKKSQKLVNQFSHRNWAGALDLLMELIRSGRQEGHLQLQDDSFFNWMISGLEDHSYTPRQEDILLILWIMNVVEGP